MKFADFRSIFAGNEQLYAEFTVLLVDLDRVPSDGVDVVISPVRDVDVLPDTGEIRLISAAARPGFGELPAALFENFRSKWPTDGVHDVDFVMTIQLPIAPDDGAELPASVQPLAGVWIGRVSEEIWLLVHPQSQYPQDLLPD
jgi:hypothetical protein